MKRDLAVLFCVVAIYLYAKCAQTRRAVQNSYFILTEGKIESWYLIDISMKTVQLLQILFYHHCTLSGLSVSVLDTILY